MAGYSTYYRNLIQDHIMAQQALTPVATFYFILCETTIVVGDTGTTVTAKETAYTNYVRLSVTANQTNFPASVAGLIANGAAITFATCGATGSGSVTDFAICDAATNGNMLMFGVLTTPRTIITGDIPTFIVGALSITLA